METCKSSQRSLDTMLNTFKTADVYSTFKTINQKKVTAFEYEETFWRKRIFASSKK